jgi:hypothetical protein
MPHLSRSRARARALWHAAPRRGIGLVEILVSITILGVVMTMVGGISSSIAKYGRADDLRTKRNLALQQQANLIGALPAVSLTATMLPTAKTFTTGDFRYSRRISMSSSTNPSLGTTTAITITIVPQTSTPSDSLKKESVTLYRTLPSCGTALDIKSC